MRALLATHGGVRPLERRRSRRHLSVQEREEVTRGIAAAVSARAIQCALVGHHRRSHERSPAIADAAATGRRPPTWRDGNVRGGQVKEFGPCLHTQPAPLIFQASHDSVFTSLNTRKSRPRSATIPTGLPSKKR